MPWDTDFHYEAIDDRHPTELLDLIVEVLGDDQRTLDSVSLGRKRRAKPRGKPQASFHKFSGYRPDEPDMEADAITAELVGAAVACAEIDGELGTGKYQATVVWVDGAGKRDRQRVVFEIPETSATAIVAARTSTCPGCAAYQEIFRTMTRAQADERRRYAIEAAKKDTVIEGLAAKRDDLAKAIAQYGAENVVAGQGAVKAGNDAMKDIMKEGGTMIKGAIEAAKPNTEATAAVLGILKSAVDLTDSALDAKRAVIEAGSEAEKAKGNRELANEGMKMIGKIGEQIIDIKMNKKKTATDKGANPKGTPSAVEQLVLLRDAIFAVLTEEEWSAVRSTIGDVATDKFVEMRTGPIDLDRFGEVVDALEEVSNKDLMLLFIKLS
jgi:hypothetical protein